MSGEPSSPSGGREPPEPTDHSGGSRPPLGATPSPWSVLHALALVFFLALWTWKLLDSNPVPGEFHLWLERMGLAFVAAKGLHLCGYAFLTALAVTLPAPRRWRWFLVGLLVLHSVGTEIGQRFVPHRTGRAWDVLIDWAGIALAVLVVGWLRGRRLLTGSPPASA